MSNEGKKSLGGVATLATVFGLAAWSWRRRKQKPKASEQNQTVRNDNTQRSGIDQEAERQMRMLMAREEWVEQRREQKTKEQQIIPLTLVVGRLGSGKTTLCRKIVSSVRDFTLGLIVNDFAQLNVDSKQLEEDVEARIANNLDGERVKGSAVIPKVVELSNGCVCCSLQNGLSRAIEAMISNTTGSSRIDYLIVETSGLTDPVEMVRIIEHDLGQGVRLDSVVYVMDADNWEQVLEEGTGDRRQLQFADVVILNKIDLLASEDNAQVDKLLRETILPSIKKHTNATVLTANFGDVPLERIMDVVKIEPEREAFGRIAQSRTERSMLGGYALPEFGGNLLRRVAVDQNYKGLHKVAGGTFSSSWKSLVFFSDLPFDLALLQENLFSNADLSSKLARMKGTVFFSQMRQDKLMFQLSGNQRVDITRTGKWVTQPSISLALVVKGGEEEVRLLKNALEASTVSESQVDADQAQAAEDIIDELNQDGNYYAEKFEKDSAVAAVKLTGKRKFGFTEEQLRVRFAVDLNAVNVSFGKCINSQGKGVIGLPLERICGTESENTENVVLISLATTTNSQKTTLLDTLESASLATFRCEFAQVRLCACD